MTRYLLDTCAVLEFAKREPNAGFLAWAHEIDPSRTYLSAMTIGELYYGIGLAHDPQKARLETWLSNEVVPEFGARILAFDAGVAARWGAIRARRAGATLSALDAAIAATASRHDLTIVTCNEMDFSNAGVSIYNPWD